MANGEFDGLTITDDELRHMFTRDYLLSSSWYHERLVKKQQIDIAMWERHAEYLRVNMSRTGREDVVQRLDLEGRHRYAQEQLIAAKSAQYVDSLVGSLGADPM